MDGYATSMHKRMIVIMSALVIALSGGAWTSFSEESESYGLGRLATEDDIRVWNMDVSPTGEGLPPGRGTVKQGARIYAEKCAACHVRMLSIRSTNGSDFHTIFHQCCSDLRGGILHGGAVSAIRNHVTDQATSTVLNQK